MICGNLLCRRALGDGRYQEQAPELESRNQNSLAKARDVVFVGATDLLDEAMGTQPLEDSPDLRSRLARQEILQVTALEAAQVEFSSQDRLHDGSILFRE